MGIMVSEQEIQSFLESYQRCEPHSEFFQKFYETLLQEYPHFQPLFEGKDVKKLARMLPLAIYGNLELINANEASVEHFKQLGQLHTEFQFPPEYMDDWLKCLLEVVAQTDPRFDEKASKSWKAVLGTGIGLMRNQLQQ